MDYDKFILLDYENFMDVYIDNIDEKTKMIIIVDEKQNTIPIELIKTTQSFGKSIEWVQIKNNGKGNTLYFFILYFLGYYIANNSNKEFIIYSSDNNYDPLIEYLQNKKINVKIISEFKQKDLNRKGFKKIISQISAFFNRLSVIQKSCITIIALTVIIGIVAIFTIPPKYSLVPVIDAPIRDQATLDRIVLRINQEGVRPVVNTAGLVQVTDEATARRMRAILIREDLIPTDIDPWAISGIPRWTITDYERNVNFQRAMKDMLTDHIKAIDDVDDANVTIRFPERELFRSDQNPVMASVIITPKPGSDITTDRKKIEGIQKLLKITIEGLQDDNIVITDQSGMVLNDFAGMAELARLTLIEKEAKHIQKLEAEYRAKVLQALQHAFSPNRIRDLNIKFDKDIVNLTQGERNPNIDRIKVSVNIDGTWKWKYDEKGNPVVLPDGSIEREYTPVPPEQLRAAQSLIQEAIVYNSARGDSVTVYNIPFDRLKEFSEEDAAYFRQKQMQMTVIIILSGLTLLLISFIIFRVIARHARVTGTKIP